MTWYPRKSVVVPIDFSPSTAGAISAARDLVDDPADVHLVHALVPLDVVSPGVALGGVDDETRAEHVRTFADEFLAGIGYADMPLEIRIGQPADEIVEYAAAVSADLIVIPSHGFHGLKRFVLGSVAERVIRHADCPVLVLRRTDAE